MANILTAPEAAAVLRCEETDQVMLDLLSQIDEYIENATGRDWSGDDPVWPTAKAAARMLVVLWHEDPGVLAANVGSLGFGLRATLTQLEALAQRWKVFEGGYGAGPIALPGARKGDTVSAVTGKVGVSGDQSAAFETVITVDDEIQQVSTADLTETWYQVYLVPPEAL